MNFLYSRAERLADFLRSQVQHGQLVEPLPGTREWSKTLGVGRGTLAQALRRLQNEGLITIQPKGGIRLRPLTRASLLRPSAASRIVRVLYYAQEFPESHYALEWIAPLSDRLHRHHLELVVEKCTDQRMREMAGSGKRRDELLVLLSLPPRHQRWFVRTGTPLVIVPEPAAGLDLPFLRVDQLGAIAHATLSLLRRGFLKLILILPQSTAPGYYRMMDAFQRACAQWPRSPLQHEVVAMPLRLEQLAPAASRLAARTKGKQGMIVVFPVSLAMIMTALLQRGIQIPNSVEIVEVMSTADSIKVSPSPTHYPFPVDKYVKALAEVAIQYFQTGIVPPVHKTIPVERVPALGDR